MNRTKQSIFCVTSITFLVAAAICLICDYCISQGLSWSLIVLLSLSFIYVIVLILLNAKKNVVLQSLIAVTVISFPFLGILSLILHVPQICSLGICIAFLSAVAIWIIFALAIKNRGRLFLIVGLAFLVSIPLSLGIVHTVTCFNGTGYTDFASDIFHVAISLVLAGGSFVIDRALHRSDA